MNDRSQEWRTPEGLTIIEGWAREGLIEKQIAHNMSISISTLRRWKKQYTDIMNALKKGKTVVDYEVENALIRRCIGYRTQEVHTIYDDAGNVAKVQIIEKEVPPDTTACIYWLKNRRPEKWQTKPIDTGSNADAMKRAYDLLGTISSVIE